MMPLFFSVHIKIISCSRGTAGNTRWFADVSSQSKHSMFLSVLHKLPTEGEECVSALIHGDSSCLFHSFFVSSRPDARGHSRLGKPSRLDVEKL